jgi:two-component system sensor histidine kinase BaeS
MHSLNTKLVLAFMLVSLVCIGLVGLFISRWIPMEFGNYMNAQDSGAVVEELAEYYQEHGSWSDVREAMPFLEEGNGARGGGSVALANRAYRVVSPGLGLQEGQSIPRDREVQRIPISVDDQVVGFLLVERHALEISMLGRRFLLAVNHALVRSTLIGLGVAIVLGAILARSLTHPLRDLTIATRAVAKGDLQQQVTVRSQDELGELGNAFNQMNTELARARDQRQQMTADIAHDLRTPLSVILGHAEALAEGVLPPTPERLRLIHDEAKRLKGLVEDLRTLSLAEGGEMALTRRAVGAQALLERTAAAHAPRTGEEGIHVQVIAEPNLPLLDVDPDRIAQVLDNLLDNALRYTPEGGQITLGAAPDGARVRLSVQDSGPGLPIEELERIFARLYRADRSRQRHDGGSGLGLAIARSLVEAHGGRIWAESTPGQGLKVIMELPTAQPG